MLHYIAIGCTEMLLIFHPVCQVLQEQVVSFVFIAFPLGLQKTQRLSESIDLYHSVQPTRQGTVFFLECLVLLCHYRLDILPGYPAPLLLHVLPSCFLLFLHFYCSFSQCMRTRPRPTVS